MRKISTKILAYSLWFVDLLLATWLFYISRWVLYIFVTPIIMDPTHYLFPKIVDVMDAVFFLLLGIAWVAFMIYSQKYYAVAARKGNLFKRFARITGFLLLFIFIIDSTFFFLQGFETEDWSRLLIISVELVLGLILVLYGRKIPNDLEDEK